MVEISEEEYRGLEGCGREREDDEETITFFKICTPKEKEKLKIMCQMNLK